MDRHGPVASIMLDAIDTIFARERSFSLLFPMPGGRNPNPHSLFSISPGEPTVSSLNMVGSQSGDGRHGAIFYSRTLVVTVLVVATTVMAVFTLRLSSKEEASSFHDQVRVPDVISFLVLLTLVHSALLLLLSLCSLKSMPLKLFRCRSKTSRKCLVTWKLSLCQQRPSLCTPTQHGPL